MSAGHDTKSARKKRAEGGLKKIALVGNPNVGKSVIFGLLTGKYATVSNYPGTTVEVSHGNLVIEGERYHVVDTPGVNSLIPMSEDEKVTRDILLAERPSVVLQVGDSKNLKRALLITIQLSEMGLPVILDLNMEDEARDLGITIDIERLSTIVGVGVVSTVAPERKGLRELKAAIRNDQRGVPTIEAKYDPEVEDCIERASGFLPKANISRRSLALMVISGDESLRGWLNANLAPSDIEKLEGLREECRKRLKKPIGTAVNEARMRVVEEAARSVTKKTPREGGSVAVFLGRASMHPIWGLPVLLAVLYGLYEFVGVFGAGTLVGFMEEVIFGRYLNPMFVKAVEAAVPVAVLRDMLVGDYGLITMALTYAIGIILPITTTFFIAFAVLEDSGYLPRLAIMSNRLFSVMGLSGKAVLPMVLGLGCGTMAVMTTRILETRRDRIIATFLLALAVPCAAQLGVIMGMLGALSGKALSIWALTVLGVLFFSGFIASKIVPGEKSDFFLEIPPIRRPAASNIIAKTSARTLWYLKEAVPLFMLGTLILFVLDRLAILKVIRRVAAPVVTGVLGLPDGATDAFLLGFLRRDYGAAGLFMMSEDGMLTPLQSVVSLVTITLFVPCLAHLLMMVKERGLKMSLAMMAVIVPAAIVFGGLLNLGLRFFDVAV